MNKKILSLLDLSRFLDNLKQIFAEFFHTHSVNDLNDCETADIKFNSVNINYFTMKDINTGYEYIVSIENGKMIYDSKLESISITKMPNKMNFIPDKDTLEESGIEITAHYQDGSSEIITNYTYEMILDSDYIDISYTKNGITCVVKLEGVVISSAQSIEEVLIDFTYADNGDDTYTITDWKGTYNGEPSTEIIIPEDKRIKL